MENHFAILLDSDTTRWNQLCSLLDDDKYWNGFQNQIRQFSESKSIPHTNVFYNSSQCLLDSFRTVTELTTARLIEILSIINHNDAISLIQSWITKDSQTEEHVSKRIKTTHANNNNLKDAIKVYEQGMYYYWRDMNEKAIPFFEKAAEMKYPLAYFRLYNCDETYYSEYKELCISSKHWFMENALTGDPIAQYHMGEYLNVIEQNLKQATAWCEKSAEQGCMFGQHWLGMYSEQDNQKVHWLQKAADQGFAAAQCSLGSYYCEKGEQEESLKWSMKAAEQGHIIAQYNVGMSLKNQEKWQDAIQWFQKAAKQGDAGAALELGLGCSELKDFKTAAYWFRKAADLDSADGMCCLGWSYDNALGVQCDIDKAVFYYRTAAEQGHMYSQRNLGHHYWKGRGVPQDYKEAAYWYQKAADQGHESAACSLGEMYLYGQGVQQNTAKGLYWLKKAAEKGHADACKVLGDQFTEGRLIRQNLAEAAHWFMIGAQSELAHSEDSARSGCQFKLGQCYYYGKGVKQDYAMAVHWYQKAAERGHEEAIVALARCNEYGDGVPQDIKEAIRLLQGIKYDCWMAQKKLDLLHETTKVQHNCKEESSIKSSV